MASFNGATFRIRGDGLYFSGWDARANIINRQPAAGDQEILPAGADVQKMSCVIRCTALELFALYDQVTEDGSLVLSFETHDALLTEVANAARVVSNADQYEATLNLIRL